MPEFRRTPAKHFMTPTRIGSHDLTCNPYIGCGHACLYCYAKTLGDQPSRPEPWGTVVEIKSYPNFDIPRNTGRKSIFFSSATDCYQPIEAKEKLTRSIFEAIKESELTVSILTKSALVVRDIDIFLQMHAIEIGFSIAFGDEAARIIEPGASRPSERIEALKELKAAGLATYVFVAPILPFVSEPLEIIDKVAPYVDYMLFDGLNLKNPDNKLSVFRYILRYHPELMSEYKAIFEEDNGRYYNELREQILIRAKEKGVRIGYLYEWR
ncbi:MAG: radical SAM protein [bacterium]